MSDVNGSSFSVQKIEHSRYRTVTTVQQLYRNTPPLDVRWRHRNVTSFDSSCHSTHFSSKIAVMTLINPDECKNQVHDGSSASIKVRTPKRILHFSDGVLEEYSTDEELDGPPKQEQAVVDPNTLTWGPWFWYKAWRAGAGTLAVVDSVGEFLAAFFGITTPKYYFELEEYKRREAEMKAEKEQKQGWSEASGGEGFQLNDITTTQPKPVNV